MLHRGLRSPGFAVRLAGRHGWALRVVAAVALASWLLVVVAWLLLPSARAVEIVIPAGTADRLAAGEEVRVIPDRLLLRRGDTLVIVNQDDVVHRVGPAFATPGRTERTRVTGAFFHDNLLCSVHPSGSIGVAPQSRPGLEATLLPTVLLAVPLAVATLLAFGIAARLKVDDPEPLPLEGSSTSAR